MSLRRYLQVVLVVFSLFIAFPQIALAGGWWKVSATDPITAGNPKWRDFAENTYYTSPHGGYTTSSNLCKTCHAVHEGSPDSYRLLKSGSTDFEVGIDDRTAGELRGEAGSFVSEEGAGNKRSTECMYCHDATSGLVENMRPYALGALGATIRGEHTLGATEIPDSDTNGGTAPAGNLPNRNPVAYGGIGAELDCYQCHSVHGANTIGNDANHDGNLDPVALDNKVYDGNDNIESWNTKILRVDPSGDGIPLSLSTTSGIDAVELANEPTAVRTGFCADCHNRNPNWVTTTDTVGPNKTSHVQGRGADGLMEVYGSADVAVAGHTAEFQGCRGCHAASDSAAADSRFPHQSVGWKLMWDSYTDNGTADLAGDPNRSLPVMDKTCLMCHPVDNEFESGKGYSDVATEQALCYRCHKVDSFAGAPDVQSQFAKAFGHPTNDSSGLHTDDTSETSAQLGTANRHAECVDCHNMEAVLQGQGRPLRGIWGASAASASAGSAPTMTKIDGVTMEYELCFKCHSSYTTRPNSNYYDDSAGFDVVQGDKALEFNPNNNAFHPVENPGRNQSTALNNTLRGGLNSTSMIKCTDCHNSDETSNTPGAVPASFKPKGPHGSVNAPVLRANYRTDLSSLPAAYDANNAALCFICHDESKLVGTTSVAGGYSNFYSPGLTSTKRNLHRLHLDGISSPVFWAGGVAVCRVCHYNIHSNQQASNTEYWYYDGIGTDIPGYPGWHRGTASPTSSVKSRLVNFAPLVNTDVSFLDPTFTKPAFRVWLVQEGTGFTARPARSRECDVVCHGNNGDSITMDDGAPGAYNSLYKPPAATDNDSLTY